MKILKNKVLQKRYLFIFPFLLTTLVFCGCNHSSAPNSFETTIKENNISIVATTVEETNSPQITEADIQGIWSYYSQEQGYTEQIIFENGIATCSSVFEAVPDNVSSSVAEYTICSDYISLYFEATDYTNRIECTWMGNELVLYKYIKTGADKGNTRIYTKMDSASITQPNNVQPESPHKESTPKETQESVSSGKRNALRSAKDYLSVMPFSYSGLIDQLEYEGYSNSEATYAADNCGADWYEQAVKSAKQYLEVMAFSRSGLIDQLEYEGYTHDQAVYGVDKAY